MKKYFITVIAVIAICLAALSGCAAVGALEKNVNVVFEVDGKNVASVTVNQFNNAIAPVYDEGAVAEGYKLMGWSAADDWQYGDDRTQLISNGGVVRYVAVKDYANAGGTAVARPVIIDKTAIPRADLVIAWYSKESTSGISQSDMDAFEESLRAYLSAEGYDADGMEIIIRGYAGNVGPTCENIRADGDVDVMLGWAGISNLTGTGGMQKGKDVLENVGGIKIGGDGAKERYAARLTDSEISNKIYAWIRSEYGDGSEPDYVYTAEPTPPPDEPEKPDDPPEIPISASETRLVIGWYNLEGTSGLNQTIIDNFENGLKAYLTEQGKTVADLTIRLRAYEDDVATSCGLIKTHGDVDVMLGWGGNINSKGGMTEGTDYIENVGGIEMGGKTRYIARITDTALVNLVFDWIKAGDAASLLALQQTDPPEEPTPPVDPDPPEDPVDKAKLVIGWWSYSSSGLTQATVDNVVNEIKSYLTSQGYDVTKIDFTVRAYDGAKVANVAEAVNADGDVDIIFGLKAYTGIEVKEQIDNIKTGESITDRRILLLSRSESEIASAVFNWFKENEDARALFVQA